MKKFLVLIAIVCMCFTLTGCFGGLVDVNINNDGSGNFTVQMGYTEMMYEMLKSIAASSGQTDSEIDEVKTFEYNGATYYGEIVTETFSSVEEFNSLIAQNQQEIDSGMFTLYQESDNSFKLNFDITSETGNTETTKMSIESMGISQEEAALMMKDAVMIFTVNIFFRKLYCFFLCFPFFTCFPLNSCIREYSSN